MRRAVVMTPCGQLKGSSPRRSGIRGRALNTIARTLLGAALGATLSVRAAAQDRPPPAAEFAAGALFFADDGVVTEGLAGGGVRIYVSPRVSIGPEVAFILGERHSHMMLTGNVTFDLRAPVKGVPREVTPFVVVGWVVSDARGVSQRRDVRFQRGRIYGGGRRESTTRLTHVRRRRVAHRLGATSPPEWRVRHPLLT